MTRKIRKVIKIDDFMKLWEKVEENKWDQVLPGWDVEMSKLFLRELTKRFNTSKQEGSYGNLWDPSIANIMWSMAGRSTTPVALNKMGYRSDYAAKYPIAWVRSGELRDRISPLVMGLPMKSDGWGIEIGIPMKTITYTEEPWKDIPPNPEGYLALEYHRSYIGSSLLLGWPAIIKKTLELVGT